MAKNSCVIITPDLKQRYCQTDNISENDLALMFYEYLESPRTPNELTDKVLNSESFIGWYNWHFKLGNSRFLIQTPSAYQNAMKNWNNMKTYGMDEEGYLVVDTPLKNKVLEWIKQNRDYETHFVIYTNLEGKTTLKVEKPTYVGKKLSRTKAMSLEGIQIQTIEDIQKFLKETHTIHRYMGKWWISKTSDGLKKLQEYIADNVIDTNKVHTTNTKKGIIVEFYEGLDLMYQKTPDIKAIVRENNRPLKALGSNKNIEEKLKRSNLTPELRKAIIEAITKNPKLKEHSLGSLLTAISIQRDRELLDIYNESFSKKVDQELDNFLQDFLKEYGFEFVIGDAIKEFGDYSGVFDAVNKVIYLANNRNKITAAEEFSHAFIKLMGKSFKGPEFKFLMDGIEDTELYKQVYNEYSSIYTKTLEDGSEVPNTYKIKEEAIGQALASAIVDKWETKNKPESEKTWWDKLKEWVNSILSKFENTEYLNFESLIDKIASEIISGDKSRLTKKYDSVDTNLLDYVETIENQTKKDGGKALEFLRFFTNIGSIITGSLAYRYQGTVYRPAQDSIHDIDLEIPKSAHGFQLSNIEFNAWKEQKNTSELAKKILEIDFFKKVKEKYPKIKFADFVMLQREVKGTKRYFISGVYSENERLSTKFLSLKGDYASRLDQFSEEERNKIYLFDFFLKEGEQSSVFDPNYNLRLKPWQPIFTVKVDEMGRDKDTFDYKMWTPFEAFKNTITTPTEDLMFQKNYNRPTINKATLFNSDGSINWEYYESILNDYHNNQPDSMFAKGRYTLATRPENHFEGEKNTLNHIKFVTQSMLDLLEGKFDVDLPFVSEARASLKNQRDLMVLAAMFHDVAKPYRHGDIHGWEAADIVRDVLGVDYNNRIAEWAVRHHMPMPFSHKAEFNLANPEALEVAKNIARDARRLGIDAQTAINAFVLINSADVINGRELYVEDNWAKKEASKGKTRYGGDISVKNVLTIELTEKVELLKKAFEEIQSEDLGDPAYNYSHQKRFDYIAFPEGGRKDGKLPYLSNEVEEYNDEEGESTIENIRPTVIVNDAEHIKHLISAATLSTNKERRAYMEDARLKITSFKKGDTIGAVELLKLFNEDSIPKQYKALANVLIPLFEKQDFHIKFTGNEDRKAAGSTFSSGTQIIKEVYINLDATKIKKEPYVTIIHELIHTLSISALNANSQLNSEVENLMGIVKDFLSKHTNEADKLKVYTVGDTTHELPFDLYGLKNSKEFFTVAFTEPSFQRLLMAIPLEKKETAWSRFLNYIVDGLKSLFNIHFSRPTNVFEALVPYIADVITKSAYLGSELTSNENIDASAWEVALNEEQLSVATKIAKEVLSMVDPYTVSDNYFTVMKNFGGYFEGGGAIIENDFPSISAEMISKLEDHIWTGSTFTEEDAIRFLQEAGYVKQQSGYTNASTFAMHSGGATGSDSYWEDVGKTYGLVKVNHYYHGKKTPRGNVPITEEQFERGKKAVYRANNTLKRKPQQYMDLLARNYIQVENADAIFAVGILKNGVVDGGTGWAVQMAIDDDKPVYVFDQIKKSWYTYVNGKWSMCDTPILTTNFAGIGTREENLTEEGKRAIRNVYAKTFGGTVVEMPVNEFEVGDRIYHQIRTFFGKKVAYSQNFKEDHIYLVKDKSGKWVPADYSVSELTEEKFDPNSPWKPVSTGLGNTNDMFMRDFFAHQLKPSYPNLTQEQYDELLKGANEVVKYLDNFLGAGNYKVSSQEFPILGYTTKGGETKTVAGTMDLLIYDKKGNFYIIDMKTKRVLGDGTPDLSNKIDGYSKQQYMYKNMLETAIPELRGRIQPPLLLVSTVSYPSPKEGYTYTQDKNGVVYASYINTNGAKVTKPITQIAGYVAPRYHSFMSTKDVDNTIKEILTVMTPEEFSLEYGTPEIIKESVAHRNKVVLNTEHSKLSAETEALYTIIPKEEVRFLGKKIASTFSYYVDMLLRDPEAKEMFTDPETGDNPFKDYDFTKMSRSELLNVSMLVDILLELIQEDLFNIENEQNVDKEDGIKAKLNAAYVNFDAIIKASYTEFIKLEGLTFNKSITKTYIPDGIDPSIINPTDPTEGEDNGREHWQLGVRNMSAMSGLSAQLRRFLSTIEEVDADNDLVADRYGYGLSTTLDGNEIVNSLLIWLKDCNTMEEMETVLSKLTATHPWIKTLLDEISNEPIRSQFFQCFRKDFTEYSIIVTVKKTDPYTGMPYWETVNRIINSVGAVDKVISEVKDAYFSRDIAIFKDGLWNSSKIESLATTIDSIQKHYKNKANWEALKKNLHNDEMFKTVKGVLESLGVMFDDTILADLIASDADVVNFIGGKLSKVLVQAKYIVESLSKGINKESYDPFEKGSNDSVYNAYKNIATIAEPYVVNALEASTYANGKMYYSFVPPSYMGQLFNNLINTDKDSLELFLENNYAKYEWFKTGDSWNIQWLNDIENNREILARKVQLSYEETDYVDLGERAYAMSLLKEYFYDQKNKSLAWYRIPTLSNKPSSEFIRNKRYSGDFRKELTKQLYNVFIQEVKRMQTVIDRAISSTITEADIIKNYDIAFSKNPEIEKAQQAVLDKIKNNKKVTRKDLFIKDKYIFEDSGVSFKFLDGFVEDIKSEDNIVGQYIIDKVFNRNNTNVKDADFIAPVKNRIGRIMESKVEAAKTYFNSIGLNDSSMNFMLQGDSITKKTTPEEAMNKLAPAIEEYVWNDFVATINIVQLTTTDLAFYKDSVDFQKRFAQVHSPGLRLNKDATNIIKGNKVKVSDGYLRSLLIKDAISPSNIKENVRVALENRYNSMEEGPAKEEFKIMKDLIISQYNKINEADAQAYTSPTGYMKKMVMAGEWTPLMQEAYERIKSGNYNVNDLGVVWQPIKPFVYTQNGVDGHSSISKNIKVPSQHKNSEYLLLIADALTRGDKQDNVLNAIMDFMEETHEDKNGNYKQDGIDTIEFDSAVKVGVHGVIDINNLPASEVKAKLKLALSNPAHIFAYPVEDYAIQQSVPDHFNDHSQPMGSQIRALILSDLIGSAYTPLKSKKAYTSDEVRKVYQDLIARNVYRSWDELAEDLNLKGDRSARNIQLSELLQEEMSKDARYGADLRRAVMLDANNEFVIPLDDPIHSSRIQQVINSIVKSRINKQRTKGGPVVQASSFGLSDELNIIFQNKNGRELPTMKDFGKKRKLKGKELEIAYKKYIEDKQATVKHFECYIPLPSNIFEEYMLVDDGKGGKRILSIEEATDPTNEYFVHGLKDCLNAIGYRIPTEDTYSMVPIKIAGFVPKAAGEAVMLPKEITLLSGSDFDIDKLYIMMPEIVKSEYNEDEARDYYRRYVEPTAKLVDAIFGETEEINYKTWLKTTGDQFKVRGIKRIQYKQLDPKAENYQEQLDKMSKQQVNNAIFDIQWGVITNEASQIKLFNPGSFDVQKKASRIVSIARDKNNNLSYDELMKMSLDELDSLIPKESRNILDATTQVYFFKQNMTAGKLIGVFANANVSHVFCNMLPITVNVSFKFNGKNYNGAKWDPTESARGRFVSKNIAGYVGASVDAVKDPVFANMNVNMNTVNAALVLIRLGVDPEEIALFTSQPIIEEFSKRMDMAKEKSSYVSAYGVMRELLTEYGTQEEIDAAFTGLPKSDFDAKDLFDNIKNENKEMSLRIGVLFSELLIHAEDMRDITYCTKFNSVTNAPGPLFTDNLYAREKVERFLRNAEDEKTMFSKQASTIISNNPILKSIYDATIGRGNIVQTISEPYWKYYGKTFTAINNKLSKMQGRPLTGEVLEKVYQDYMLYCLNNLDFTSADDRAELIIKFPEYFTKTIKEFKENNPEFYEKEIKYNPFIQRIKKVVPGKFPLYTLQMEAGKLNGELSEEMKIGWANMVESENPKLRELGVSLFFYNLYRSGFRFSPKTFLHLAPVEVKYAIYNYVSYLSDNKLFELDSYQIYDFVVQYYRNHPDDLHNSDITYNNSNTGNYMFKTSDVVLTSSPFYVTVQPIVKVDDELFVAKKSSCEPGTLEVEYIKVGRLGYNNDVVEYLPVGKHDAPSQIIPLVESTIKTTKLPNNQDSGLLDQMQGKKSAHSVQTEKKVDEPAVNPSKPEIPSQITEEQLAKLISTLPKDFDDVVPMYKEGGILNTSMSVDEMLKTLFKHHPEFKQMFMASGVLDKEGFNEFQAALSDMHNKIIEAIKNIC